MIVKLCLQHDSVALVNERQLTVVFIVNRQMAAPFCQLHYIPTPHVNHSTVAYWLFVLYCRGREELEHTI